MDLKQEVFYTIYISVLCWLTCIRRCSGNLYNTDVNQSEVITLKCNHEMLPGTTHIGWEYKRNGNSETIATIKTNGLDSLQFSSKQFLGRIDIYLPSGDLVLNSVEIQDEGEYICFMLITGISVNAKGLYFVNVLVPPPKDIAILCSNTKDGILWPVTACIDIPDEEIKSLSCTTNTKPRSKIQWLSPNDCNGSTPQEFCEEAEDMIYNCVSTQTSVCPGEYRCIVNYSKLPNPILSPAIVVDFRTGFGTKMYMRSASNARINTGAVIAATSAPVTGNTSSTFSVILVAIIAIIIAIAIIGFIFWKRRRPTGEQNQNEYMKPIDANPESPPSVHVEVESPEPKGDETPPTKNIDDQLFITCKNPAIENQRDADENYMQLTRGAGENQEQNQNEHKKLLDANPESPPSVHVEVESPEQKRDETPPTKNIDDQLFFTCKNPAIEKQCDTDENNMQLARINGGCQGEGEEDDQFLSLNHDNSNALNPQLQLAAVNRMQQRQNQVTVNTRNFFNVAQNLGPNKIVRYKKEDQDGVKREFEVETKGESEPQTFPIVTLMP